MHAMHGNMDRDVEVVQRKWRASEAPGTTRVAYSLRSVGDHMGQAAVFTDGGSVHMPGPDGSPARVAVWAALMVDGLAWAAPVAVAPASPAYRGAESATAYAAEVQGIAEGAKLLAGAGVPGPSGSGIRPTATIYCDSAQAIDAVHGTARTAAQPRLIAYARECLNQAEQLWDVRLCWLRGHAGWVGNEAADRQVAEVFGPEADRALIPRIGTPCPCADSRTWLQWAAESFQVWVPAEPLGLRLGLGMPRPGPIAAPTGGPIGPGDSALPAAVPPVVYAVVTRHAKQFVHTWSELQLILRAHHGAYWKRCNGEHEAVTWLEACGDSAPQVAPGQLQRPAWLISVCDGTGLPRVAMHTAALELASQGTFIVWERVLVVERQAEVRNFADKVVESLAPRAWTHLRAPEILPHLEDLEAWAAAILDWDPAMLLLVIAGTDCTRLSQAHPRNQGRGPMPRGLHQAPSNAFHALRNALVVLTTQVGVRKLAVVAEMVCPANPLDDAELTTVLGAPVQVDGADYGPHGGARRCRRYRCTPTVGAPIPVNRAHARRGWPGDLVWPVPGTPGIHSAPPTITAFWPQLVSRFGALGVAASLWTRSDAVPTLRTSILGGAQVDISSQELDRLRGLRVWHPAHGALYAPAAAIAAWMALDIRELPWQKCDHPDDPERCGRSQYCHSCSFFIETLGRAWHLGSAISVIRPWLQAVVQPDRDDWPSPWVAAGRHVCGPRCPITQQTEEGR